MKDGCQREVSSPLRHREAAGRGDPVTAFAKGNAVALTPALSRGGEGVSRAVRSDGLGHVR